MVFLGSLRDKFFKYCYQSPLLIQLAESPGKCPLGRFSFHKDKGDAGEGFTLILIGHLLKIS